MQKVLGALSENRGVIVGETIGDARLLFANDVVSTLVGRAITGELNPNDVEDLDVLGQVAVEIEEGIGAFVKFVNGVLERYLGLAIERGAEWKPVPDQPP